MLSFSSRKMAAKRQSVEEILNSEKFITGSDYQGCFEGNNDVADLDFIGDQNDHDGLARDIPKLSDRKSIDSEMILTFNQCKNKKLQHLENKMSCIKTKLEFACKKTATITIDDLILLLHRKYSSIVRTFTQSNLKALKKTS